MLDTALGANAVAPWLDALRAASSATPALRAVAALVRASFRLAARAARAWAFLPTRLADRFACGAFVRAPLPVPAGVAPLRRSALPVTRLADTAVPDLVAALPRVAAFGTLDFGPAPHLEPRYGAKTRRLCRATPWLAFRPGGFSKITITTRASKKRQKEPWISAAEVWYSLPRKRKQDLSTKRAKRAAGQTGRSSFAVTSGSAVQTGPLFLLPWRSKDADRKPDARKRRGRAQPRGEGRMCARARCGAHATRPRGRPQNNFGENSNFRKVKFRLGQAKCPPLGLDVL